MRSKYCSRDRKALVKTACRFLSSIAETLYMIRRLSTFSRRFTTASPGYQRGTWDRRTVVNDGIYYSFHLPSVVETG
jgi:hypothetical protein